MTTVKTALEPRRHAVPGRFETYVRELDPQALTQWANEVHGHLQSGMSSAAVAELSTEDGWDKSFAQWLVDFTHAQKRPIAPVIASDIQADRERDSLRAYRKWSRIWGGSYFGGLAVLIAAVPLVLYGLAGNILFAWFLATLYCGYRFFSLWADRKGYSAGYGWLTLVPPLLLPVIWFLWILVAFP